MGRLSSSLELERFWLIDPPFLKRLNSSYTLSFSGFKKLRSEKHIRAKPFPGAGFGFGKLYVTNSDFSNGIGRLCIIILRPFFPSVKFLMPNILSKVEMSCFLGSGFYEFASSYE
jgi:hypothetical protein